MTEYQTKHALLNEPFLTIRNTIGFGWVLRNLTRGWCGSRGTRRRARTLTWRSRPSALVRLATVPGLEDSRGMFFIQLVLAAYKDRISVRSDEKLCTL